MIIQALKSIRFKALFWYIIILTGTLLAFSVVLYGGFIKTLYDDLDDLLSSRAEGVANSIHAYWYASQRDPAGHREDFIKVASGWVEEKRADPDLMSIFVRILDAKGQNIVASRHMPRVERLDSEDLEDVITGEDDFDTVSGDDSGGKKARYRVYTKPVMEGDNAAYIVQVIGPIGLMGLALGNLRLVLFVVLPLAVFLAAIPGVMLVRLTLKPIDRMIVTLKGITAENMKLRIHMPDTKDEIRRLADTFNDMIERLDKSFSSQQRFIQNISNELKSPMLELKKELESAAGPDTPPAKRAALMARASTELGEYSRTIENLIAFNLFDANGVPLEIRRVNLNHVLRDAVDSASKKAAEKGISLSSVIHDDIRIDGDERQLAQLFLNLLDNAVKFTSRKGSVVVTAKNNGRFAVVSVSDSGIGIEEDDIPYIFDRFYQAAKSRVAKEGFGMGLSVVRSVVDAHKGIINVESRAEKGSTFVVSLPVNYPG